MKNICTALLIFISFVGYIEVRQIKIFNKWNLLWLHWRIKYGKLNGLLYGISQGPEYEIVLVFLVIFSVGDSVGSSKEFKYGNIYGILYGNYLVGKGRFYPLVELWYEYRSF